MPSFNLLTSAWLPVLEPDGVFREAGLSEALERAHELRLAVRPGSMEHAALLRLLMAVYDAACGPADRREWAAAWTSATFDLVRVRAYAERWRDRFDLFDPVRPVFQAGGITEFGRKQTALLPEYLGSDIGLLFNQGKLTSAAPLPAGAAARHLLVRLAFDVAGIKGGIAGGRTYGAKVGHLGSVTHLSLREAAAPTIKSELLLNLPPQPRTPADRPIWEEDADLPLTPGAERPVSGRLAWWTWPSRLMRLEADADGGVVGLAWHDGLRPVLDSDLFALARAHDPVTGWRSENGRRLPVGDAYGYVQPWVAAQVLPSGSAVVEHVSRAVREGVVAPGLLLHAVLSCPTYNRHMSVMTGDPGGVALLGPAGLVADPEGALLLAAAGRFAGRVPGAVQTVTGNVGPGVTPPDARNLVLPSLDDAWYDLAASLGEARARVVVGSLIEDDDASDAIEAWRAIVLEMASGLVDSQVHGSVTTKAKVRAQVGAYLRSLPMVEAPEAGQNGPEAGDVKPRPRARKSAGSGQRRGRPAVLYEAFGSSKSLEDWLADPECEVGRSTLWKRLRAGEDMATALKGRRSGRIGPVRE